MIFAETRASKRTDLWSFCRAAPDKWILRYNSHLISSYSEHVPDHKPLVSHRYNCRTILHIYCRHFIWPHPRAVVPLPPPPPHPLPLYDEMTPSLWIYKTSYRSCGSLEYLSGWTSSGSKIYIWCSAQTDPQIQLFKLRLGTTELTEFNHRATECANEII